MGRGNLAATAVLGPFIYKMLESGDAADESSKAQETLAEKVDRTGIATKRSTRR